MTRTAVLVLSLLACSPVAAFAQNSGSPGNSELLGAPGYKAEEEAAKRAASRKQVEDQIAKARAGKKLAAEQAAAAKKAEARKAEEARLAKQAEELKVLEARLKAREEELAAEQERVEKLRAEIEDEREIAEAPGEALNPPFESPALEDPPAPMRLDASIRSCAFAGEDKALARDYLSARYVRPPRFYERNAFDDVWELRGVMRIEDGRGYLLADTVCELDEDGRVQYFAFLRSGY